jgi:hypothetical protein
MDDFMQKTLLLFSIVCFSFSINAQSPLENTHWNIGPDSIHFQKDSFFVTAFGSLKVKGIYADTANTLRLNDYSGSDACDSVLTGIYGMIFSSRKDTLDLTKISDDCPNRSTDLDGAVLTQKDLFISVQSSQLSGSLSCFPNPFNDVIYFKSNGLKAFSVQIINQHGQLVVEEQWLIGSGSIDVKFLKKGYFILILKQDGIETRKRIIKN